METKEHILHWIDTLKEQISSISITDDPEPDFSQEKEAFIKLISYLEKLELHKYEEV